MDIGNTIPQKYYDYKKIDFGNKLIIPGFVDLHIHAPQFQTRGIGLDNELLKWLDTYTFPEEAKFSDLDYSKKVYTEFIKELWKNGTTRAVVFATCHKDATKLLFELFIKSKLGAFIGKVNMDRNSNELLQENTLESLDNTKEILDQYTDNNCIVKPIITPRFVPTCTDELMVGLSSLAKNYNVPIQSHLSESIGEIELVQSLYPHEKNYASIYNKFGLFGHTPTIMAHCIHNTEEEIELMKEKSIYVAHCPISNFNLISGIAPIKKYINYGIKVGIGTDVSGGHSISMKDSIVAAVQSSKMYYVHVNNKYGYLTLPEAFYLATKGSGEFFGKIGSFEKEYEFDAIVIDDSNFIENNNYNLINRLEKYIYLGTSSQIVKRYVGGKEVTEPKY